MSVTPLPLTFRWSKVQTVKHEYYSIKSSLKIGLKFDEVQNSYQERHNYMYKGVELALKFSSEWKHHLELEIVVDDKFKKEEAEKKILAVAEELDVKIMSEEELKEFVKKVEAEKKKEREPASK